MATTNIAVTTTGDINASIGICSGPSGVFFSLPTSDPDTLLRMLEHTRTEIVRQYRNNSITRTPALVTPVS